MQVFVGAHRVAAAAAATAALTVAEGLVWLRQLLLLGIVYNVGLGQATQRLLLLGQQLEARGGGVQARQRVFGARAH
jgi:hypothetical protein